MNALADIPLGLWVVMGIAAGLVAACVWLAALIADAPEYPTVPDESVRVTYVGQDAYTEQTLASYRGAAVEVDDAA